MKRDIFVRALFKLLLPVVEWCIKHGIKIQDFNDLAKRAFITVAKEELQREGQKYSRSRVSVMTGIQRRDIAKFESGDSSKAEPAHFLTKLIGQWLNDKSYHSKDGSPRILSIEEFNNLVQSISSDLNPYTALFELERLKAVSKQEGNVRLIAEVFVPNEDIDSKLTFLAEDVSDLFSCVDTNTFESPELPHLHIRTDYDNISAEDLGVIKDWILDYGMKSHKEIRDFLSQFDKDLNPTLHKKEGGVRVSVCTFSNVENSSEDS